VLFISTFEVVREKLIEVIVDSEKIQETILGSIIQYFTNRELPRNRLELKL
jgi:hypothetical protein